MTVRSTSPKPDAGQERYRPGPGPAGDQHRGPAAAHHRTGQEQPAGAAAGRIDAGKLGRDDMRVAEFSHCGFGRLVRGQALPPIGLVRLGQPVGQFLNDRGGQLRG